MVPGVEPEAYIQQLLDTDADVTHLPPTKLEGRPPTHLLERLLAKGWDINYRMKNSRMGDAQPFLWKAVGDVELVAWCLDHDASVHPLRQDPLRDDLIEPDQPNCWTVLEWAAGYEARRFGWTPLHQAIKTATFGYVDRHRPRTHHMVNGQLVERTDMSYQSGGVANKEMTQGTSATHLGRRDPPELRGRADTYAERMATVRHLVDVVGLDVSGPDKPEGQFIHSRGYSTLENAVHLDVCEVDSTGLFLFLLRRGADPTPVLETMASLRRQSDPEYTWFKEAMRQWEVEKCQRSGSKCMVQ